MTRISATGSFRSPSGMLSRPARRRLAGCGFSSDQTSRTRIYPTHLLDGMLRCGCCGSPVALVGGKGTGYYGCSGRRRHACDNRLTVPRSRVETIFLGAVRDRLLEPGAVDYVLRRVSAEIRKLSGHVADERAGKQAELAQVQKRLDRLVEAVASGGLSGSTSLAAAITQAEARMSSLPTPGVRTTLPGLLWMRSSSSTRPAPLAARTVVRDLCDGGGGGSRTRVRRSSAEGIYMLVRP